MKKIFKILLVIIIFLFFLTSILYGLRIINTSYQYEYLGNALVITIPNKLWFETNSQQDSLVKDSIPTYIFENNLLEYTPSGYNIGYLYPTYTAQIANGTISKTDVVTREKDTLNILRTIKLEGSEGYDSYTSKITFSEFGSYANNTFSQEGCNIHISSQNGDISYIKDSSIILISYKINEMEYIRDTINIIIECKGL